MSDRTVTVKMVSGGCGYTTTRHYLGQTDNNGTMRTLCARRIMAYRYNRTPHVNCSRCAYVHSQQRVRGQA